MGMKAKVRESEVGKEMFDNLHRFKRLLWSELGEADKFSPNQYVIVTSGTSRQPCRADKTGEWLEIVNRSDCTASGIKARPGNEEQLVALHALNDLSVPIVVLTGRAGSGKTLLALAAACDQIAEGKKDGIVLIKPMTPVGDIDLGALPGTVDEKFGPYLGSYFDNFRVITGESDPAILMEKLNIELCPIQLLRGRSFNDKIVILDEAQSLNKHEILTACTRIGENSRLFLMADFAQRDNGIELDDSGLNHMLKHTKFNGSKLTSAVSLVKTERSSLVALVSDFFDV